METRHSQFERFSPMTEDSEQHEEVETSAFSSSARHIKRGRLSLHMKAVAALSVVALVSVLAWQMTSPWRNSEVSSTSYVRVSMKNTGDVNSRLNWQRPLEGSPTSVKSDSTERDPGDLSNIGRNVLGTLIGSYVAMKDSGTYTPSQAEQIAESIAEDLKANITYRSYSAENLAVDPDVSLSRMLLYRNDLRIALEPLLQNTKYELEVFAYYLESKDVSYLAELERIASNYRAAVENALEVVVPKDAAQHHVGILNSLSEFEAVLIGMADNADDPFASAALLRTFGSAEQNMFTSFNALAGYFRGHLQT